MTEVAVQDRRDFDSARFTWSHLGWGNWASAVIGPKAQELGAKVWGVNFHNSNTGDLLAVQGHRYHVIEFGPGQHTVANQVTGLAGVLHAPTTPRDVVGQIASSALVTLTVTPNGYEPDGDAVKYLKDGLNLRFEMGLAPSVVMSCDNSRVGLNGDRLRNAVFLCAETDGHESDSAFARWLSEVAFVNTVVDRIVTTPTGEHFEWIAAQDGPITLDLRPIVTERLPQHHLIIELPADRHSHRAVVATLASTQTPALLVDDIKPWSAAKSWLMNGTHAVVGMAGRLLGYEYAHEAIADPRVNALVADFLAEALPVIDAPAEQLMAFASEIIARVANPRLPDRLTRLTLDIFGKVPRLMDPWIQRIAMGHEQSPGRARVMATWAAYVHGIRTGSLDVDPVDAKTSGHVLMQGSLDLRDEDTAVKALEYAGGYRFSGRELTSFRAELGTAMSHIATVLERPDFAPERVAGVQRIAQPGFAAGDAGLAAAP